MKYGRHYLIDNMTAPIKPILCRKASKRLADSCRRVYGFSGPYAVGYGDALDAARMVEQDARERAERALCYSCKEHELRYGMDMFQCNQKCPVIKTFMEHFDK